MPSIFTSCMIHMHSSIRKLKRGCRKHSLCIFECSHAHTECCGLCGNVVQLPRIRQVRCVHFQTVLVLALQKLQSEHTGHMECMVYLRHYLPLLRVAITQSTILTSTRDRLAVAMPCPNKSADRWGNQNRRQNAHRSRETKSIRHNQTQSPPKNIGSNNCHSISYQICRCLSTTKAPRSGFQHQPNYQRGSFICTCLAAGMKTRNKKRTRHRKSVLKVAAMAHSGLPVVYQCLVAQAHMSVDLGYKRAACACKVNCPISTG